MFLEIHLQGRFRRLPNRQGFLELTSQGMLVSWYGYIYTYFSNRIENVLQGFYETKHKMDMRNITWLLCVKNGSSNLVKSFL